MPETKARAKKFVIHCSHGYQPRLDSLVEQWIRDGVVFVGAVGKDCAKVEEIIDELCVGDGSKPYYMLTSSHPDESLEDAIEFAESLTGEHAGPVEVVEL
jgi:hypothetical protein